MIQGFSGGLLNRELIYNLDLPSFQRDFASLKTLDHGTGPAITFTRASGATFFDANGVLQSAANNVPRFDHDPVNGNSRGLLIEEARTNLLIRSAELDNAAWTKVDATVTANAITAPDGTTTAEKLVEDAASSEHYAVNVVTLGSVTMTQSVFLKAGERTRALVYLSDFISAVAYADVNLTAGTAVALAQAPWTNASATIQPVGNGWFRASITATAGQGAAKGGAVFLVDDNGQANYTGNGTSGLYVWGAQLELGAFPTSYIPTTSAAATRSAESAVVTPISSFYNQAEGTLFAESSSSALVAGDNQGIWGFGDDTIAFDSAKTLYAIYDTNNSHRITVTGIGETTLISALNNTGVSQSANVVARSIFSCSTSGCAISTNGADAATGSVVDMPRVTGFSIGGLQKAWSGGDNHLNGHIRKIAYFPKRLTNALLQQLTT